jgi:hypothetical protein
VLHSQRQDEIPSRMERFPNWSGEAAIGIGCVHRA